VEGNKEESLIVRDFLARQRTKLANDRTLLAYIRTSLYFLVSGVALIKVEDLENVREFGYLSFLISVLLVALGFLNYFRLRRKLRDGQYNSM
jgi:putative membrane protein